MILGIGTDIIEIDRIKRACLNESFLERAFTKSELDEAKGSVSFLAGCFAVKEAVAKCFGTGVSGFGLTDIEALRGSKGKPYVNLYNNAKKIFEALGGTNIQVSISDTKDIAVAFAIIEGKGDTYG